MAPDNHGSYESVPPIPTYDEAVAGGSAWHSRDDYPHSPIDDGRSGEIEGQSLLGSRYPPPSSSNHNVATGRRPRGYRPPTVETDDEDGLLSSSSDSDSDGEADFVRREMEELEMDDSDVRGGRGRSSWGKRIGFSLSLPQWRWRWRWRLPSIQLGREPDRAGLGGGGGGSSDDAPDGASPASRFALPTLGSTALFLIVGRVLAILLVLGFLYLLFVSDLFSNMARRMGSQMFDPEDLRRHVQMSVKPQRIRDTLRHFTGYAHLAGTEGDFDLAKDTEMLFQKYGLEDVTVDTYHVYINYPKPDGRAVEILGPDGAPLWAAKLEEEELGVEVAGRPTLAFHGHSKSGDVKGPLVYANYGTMEDYEAIRAGGIDPKGAIALVRNYGSPSDISLKVKGAELAGFAGCLIYSDPADDGFVKGVPAPVGLYMPADGVHRDAVSLTSWVVGDVLTPGWASKEDLPRLKPEESSALVKIPSLPLAWRDAQVLLQHLKGHGNRVPDLWVGGVPDVGEWWTGNSTSPIVRLKNEQDEVEKQPIWNVYGRITGLEQPEKKIIIGNHRDSWSFGAADPHSGTAVMMEVIRIFGDLVTKGWRPRRTIEFMSWDGQGYNLLGSTEYVEQNDESLRKDALAYINLAKAVTGDTFRAAGSPVFHKSLLQVMRRIADPTYNETTTLRHLWDRRKGNLEGLGTDSDYVAFQDIVGTSSLDLHFEGPAIPSHSSYESFEWMEQVGDPGFIYHTLLTELVNLLVLDLSDQPIMPFDLTHYTVALSDWIDKLEAWAAKQPMGDKRVLSLEPLRLAYLEVDAAVREFKKWEASWQNSILASSGFEPMGLGRKRNEYNSRMARFESDLLDDAGVSRFPPILFPPPRPP